MTNPSAPNPRVSVCVPTYNGAAYLRECLSSIQAQTLGDFEVVIADDASSDDTVQVAAEFVQRDPRFRLEKNPRRLGLVGNWTRCIELSRGTWIKLLFQDDLMDKACLERLVESCERHKCNFGFCEREMIFDDSVDGPTREAYSRLRDMVSELFKGREFMDHAAFARLCADKLAVNFVGEPTVTLFHRSIFRDYGGFNPQLVQLCDLEYWVRVGANIGVVHVREKLASFRVHGGSATSQNQVSRAYQKNVLDPLLVRYLALRDPRCRNVRAALYQRPGRLVSWWRLVHYAGKAADLAGADAEVKIQNDWQAVLVTYPELRSFARAGVFLTHFRNAGHRLGILPPPK